MSAEVDGVAGLLFVFQCPLLSGTVKLAQVIDAGVGLRSGAGPDEIRNRNGCKEADDGHHDHDFYQGETRFPVCANFHTARYFLLAR